ncbi:hypothetical protein HQ487_04420 [Candidatus Uhrbacteria bacterium]|nr:hypothetical protein [Candidatus Uhrbacteria bacterium]
MRERGETQRIPRHQQLDVRGRVEQESEKQLDTPVQLDVIGEHARDARISRMALSDEEWVKRVLEESRQVEEILEGYVWQNQLQEEISRVSPEGIKRSREKDTPPPPLFDEAFGEPVIPKQLYASGLVWEVGEKIGQGAFGKVFEISHAGADQPKRVVKFMGIRDTDKEAVQKRGFLWNEVGASMAVGDYVNEETIYDEEGNIWSAIILERHTGETLAKIVRDRKETKEAFTEQEQATWAYKQAMGLRGIFSLLRRMHAGGWTHRDIKPANLMMNGTGGEESLSRPIDYGASEKRGVIRRTQSSLIIGSPNYLLPEAWHQEDVDLRIKDYWAALISIGASLEVFGFQDRITSPSLFGKLSLGTYFTGPDLSDEQSAQTFFTQKNIVGAQQEFMTWIYQFIQPKKSTGERKAYWRKQGITQTLDIPPVESAQIQLLEGDELFERDQADFLDDDRFIRELEGHIRALAIQSGVESPDEILESLQEFSKTQVFSERIRKEERDGS